MTSRFTRDQESVARGYAWANRITTISLEMVLPPLGGYWLDGKFGTLPLFTILGLILGFSTALWHLVKITRQQNQFKSQPNSKSDSKSSEDSLTTSTENQTSSSTESSGSSFEDDLSEI